MTKFYSIVFSLAFYAIFVLSGYFYFDVVNEYTTVSYFMIYGFYAAFILAYTYGTWKTKDSLLVIKLATEEKEQNKFIKHLTSIWFLGIGISFFINEQFYAGSLAIVIYTCRVAFDVILAYRINKVEKLQQNNNRMQNGI